jgi:outer membrane receptor for ferrienterochelin and colicin
MRRRDPLSWLPLPWIWRLLALSSCLWASWASAAENEFADLSLDELMSVDIATSPTFIPTRPQQAPGSVYTFDRLDFERLGVRRIEQLFRFIPGFQLNQYRKRHTSIWSRGIIDRENSKMVVVVDGIPRRRPYYGQFVLGEQTSLARVEKVEVILGPASSLYGANAFGGIISITSRKTSNAGERQLVVEGGDNQRLAGSLWFGGEETQLFARHLAQQAPYAADRNSFIGIAASQPLEESYTNLYLNHSLGEALSLSLDLYRNDYPFLFIPPTQDAFIRERSLSAALNWASGKPASGRTEAALYYNRDRSREGETEKVSRKPGYEEMQHGDLFGGYLRHLRGFDDHVLLIGAEWQREDGVDFSYTRWFHYADGFLDPPERGYLIDDPRFSTENYALYLQDVWHLSDDLTLTLGARQDRFDDFGNHFNYRAAAVYTPSRSESWKLLYGTAIRTPSYREYMKKLESDFTPPPLEAEQITSLEGAYLREINGVNLGVTLFYNSLENFIRETPTPDSADEYFANSDGKWTMQGVELLAEYHHSRNLYLHATLSYLKAHWDRAGTPPYLARYNASLALDYTPNGVHHLGLSASHTGRRDDDNDYSDDDSDGYWLVNLHAHGPITPALRYQIGIDNLFDREIFDPAADFGGKYNNENRRREIWAQLSWQF